MRKLRTIRPWRLRAVRLRTINVSAPSIPESVASRAPGGLAPAELFVMCRGIVEKVSARTSNQVLRSGPRGERVRIVLPRQSILAQR